LIERVTPGSAAEKCGLKKGDTVISVDGVELAEPGDLTEEIGNREVGDEIAIVAMRKDQKLTLTATLGLRSAAALRGDNSGYLGIAVEESDGKLRVKAVAPESPAAHAGVTVGLELKAFQGEAVASVRDYLRALKKCQAGQTVRVETGEGELAIVLSTVPRDGDLGR
jgi:S1-C subfamily serine protease